MATVMTRGTAARLSSSDSGGLNTCPMPEKSPAPAAADHIVMSSSPRLLRLKQVMERTGLKKTKLYQMQSDGSFPMRTQITSGAVGWVEEDVQQWIARRIAASKPLRVK
jgi:prophage regulatory protein